jgi:hypothetical protein
MLNRNNIPAPALEKLIALSDAAEYRSNKLIATEQGIASARARLTGGFAKNTEYDDVRMTLETMVADLPALKQRCRAAESIHSKCRQWLDDLPADVVVEPVKTNVDGHDLSSVREQIKVAKDELAQLRGLPTVPADIESRVRTYVESLGKPTISGLGKSERLKVCWPGAGFDEKGPKEKADPLALCALLFPDAMIEALTRQIERQTPNVIPIKDRSARIAALETKLIDLAYVEEALVTAAIADGKDVQRSPNTAPQAVLQVRVAE